MTISDVASPDAYDEICRILDIEYGVDLRSANPGVVQAKFRKFLDLNGLSELAQCLESIRNDPAQLQSLADIIYSQSTHFNREPEHFRYLVKTVLEEQPRRRASPTDRLEIWCPGCSTGQEAYTIAIYLMEYVFTDSQAADAIHITGADCSLPSLETALAGVYPLDDVKGLTPIPYEKYFVEAGQGNLSVGPAVRRQVDFVEFNLVTAEYGPEASLDWVFLRNAIDFHTVESQRKILTKVRRALKEGGYLVLGAFPVIGMDPAPGRKFELTAPGCYRATRH